MDTLVYSAYNAVYIRVILYLYHTREMKLNIEWGVKGTKRFKISRQYQQHSPLSVYLVCSVYGMHTFSIAVIKLLAIRAHSMVPLFISLETDSIYPFLLVFAMMGQTKSRQNTGNCRIVMSPSK